MEEQRDPPQIRESLGETVERADFATRFKPGVSGNPGGRPKNTLKDYLRRKFCAMSDAEKEEFLKKVPEAEQFRMAEGHPHQTNDLTSQDQRIFAVPSELIEKNGIAPDTGDDSFR